MSNLVELKKEELMTVEGGFNPLYLLAGIAVMLGASHDNECSAGVGEQCQWLANRADSNANTLAGASRFGEM